MLVKYKSNQWCHVWTPLMWMTLSIPCKLCLWSLKKAGDEVSWRFWAWKAPAIGSYVKRMTKECLETIQSALEESLKRLYEASVLLFLPIKLLPFSVSFKWILQILESEYYMEWVLSVFTCSTSCCIFPVTPIFSSASRSLGFVTGWIRRLEPWDESEWIAAPFKVLIAQEI